VDTPKPGLCTTWLQSLQPGDEVQVYQRAPTEFRVPVAPDARYIMVCAGSGIGPFLGFLEHRKNSNVKSGFSWLVFGCRNKGKDDLHIDLLNSYLKGCYAYCKLLNLRLKG
jgi:sulfite reductase alpha subunit-like flavoprotein